MIYIVAVLNVFGFFVLWKHFRLLKTSYYDVNAQLEHHKRLRLQAEYECEAWKTQYRLLEQTLNKLKRVGIEPADKGRRA